MAEAQRTATVDGHTLPMLCSIDLGSPHALLPTMRDGVTGPVADEAVARVDALIDMGARLPPGDHQVGTVCRCSHRRATGPSHG